MGAAAGLQGFADGTGGGMMCKWLKDEVCVNGDCPAVADFCPVVNHPGVCRYEEMDENKIVGSKMDIKDGGNNDAESID